MTVRCVAGGRAGRKRTAEQNEDGAAPQRRLKVDVSAGARAATTDEFRDDKQRNPQIRRPRDGQGWTGIGFLSSPSRGGASSILAKVN